MSARPFWERTLSPRKPRATRALTSKPSCRDMLPAIAADGLADAVDAFCEHIAFSPEETAQFFSATRALGFPVRLHADQLSDLGGATLGARFSALSADHLGYANDAGRGCYGPLPALPLCSCRGAFYFIRERRLPPVD